MNKYLLYIIIGFCGGVVRGLVGIIKNKSPENFTFNTKYFITTVLISGVVGAAAGIIADTDPKISFLAGYSGTDFIESLYKIKLANIIPIKN